MTRPNSAALEIDSIQNALAVLPAKLVLVDIGIKFNRKTAVVLSVRTDPEPGQRCPANPGTQRIALILRRRECGPRHQVDRGCRSRRA